MEILFLLQRQIRYIPPEIQAIIYSFYIENIKKTKTFLHHDLNLYFAVKKRAYSLLQRAFPVMFQELDAENYNILLQIFRDYVPSNFKE